MDIIIAPHPDDEIIGCYGILATKRTHIWYYSQEPKKIDYMKFIMKIKETRSYNSISSYLEKDLYKEPKNCTFYFPDPIYEYHPLHRQLGSMGEAAYRNGLDVVFYTVNMNAPYIHECKDPNGKLEVLNEVYSHNKSLWEYEHKYFLFEGRCKWL